MEELNSWCLHSFPAEGLHAEYRACWELHTAVTGHRYARRSNLDPWGRHTDAALWEVLRHVQLSGCVSAMGSGLTSRMAEGGDNLSTGQRQLFCLARCGRERVQQTSVLASA